MEQKQYEYRHLNDLEDECLSTVLSSCPYPLLALVLKETPEAIRERILGLLDG